MYVNVIDRDNGHSSLYECQQIHFNGIMNFSYDKTLTVDLIGESEAKSLHLDMKVFDLFVMNNDGKTIESYRWATHYKKQEPNEELK